MKPALEYATGLLALLALWGTVFALVEMAGAMMGGGP